jgi:hypothetical protein
VAGSQDSAAAEKLWDESFLGEKNHLPTFNWDGGGIQKKKQHFRRLNKFIAERRIFDAHPGTSYSINI